MTTSIKEAKDAIQAQIDRVQIELDHLRGLVGQLMGDNVMTKICNSCQTDEELDAEEAKEIEDFLKANPKLKDELSSHNGPWNESYLSNLGSIKSTIQNLVDSFK